MPITRIELLGYRGFRQRGAIDFAVSNGTRGSGLTLITGPNNAGESCVLECLRARAGESNPSFTVGTRNAEIHDPVIEVQWYQAEVKHLTVARGHEGRGHAKALIREVENAASAAGRRILQCTIREGNAESRDLFVDLGFEPVSRFFYPATGNNVEVFQKVLSPAKDG
jgi:ribosomal protein S18 acetylase RimI-like enzyme